MSSVKEFVDNFDKNPEENAKRMLEMMEKHRQEMQKNFDNFLSSVISDLDNTDEKTVKIKVEENGTFVSDNIQQFIEELSKIGWKITNIADFNRIKNCPVTERGFLYTDLLNLALILEKSN